jgi:hypothetical protein
MEAEEVWSLGLIGLYTFFYRQKIDTYDIRLYNAMR